MYYSLHLPCLLGLFEMLYFNVFHQNLKSFNCYFFQKKKVVPHFLTLYLSGTMSYSFPHFCMGHWLVASCLLQELGVLIFLWSVWIFLLAASSTNDSSCLYRFLDGIWFGIWLHLGQKFLSLTFNHETLSVTIFLVSI